MKLEKPIKAKHIGCLNCGGNKSRLPLNTRLYNSFGGYRITKNGELFFMEDSDKEFNENKTLMYIENQARKEPDADWRCLLDLSLRGAKYQRQGKNQWLCYSENEGFA